MPQQVKVLAAKPDYTNSNLEFNPQHISCRRRKLPSCPLTSACTVWHTGALPNTISEMDLKNKLKIKVGLVGAIFSLAFILLSYIIP